MFPWNAGFLLSPKQEAPSESRDYLLGYQSTEIETLKTLESIKPDLLAFNLKFNDSSFRGVEQVSLGCHSVGFALPHIDTRHARSLAMGTYGRMGKVLPPVKDPQFYEKLKTLTNNWIKDRKIQSLPRDYDFSVESWLSKTHYPEWRKEQLRKVHEEVLHMYERNDKEELKNFRVKLFCKDEVYVDFKHARGIYAREDVAKIVFGPYFKAMEEELYKQPEFIKHVPVQERAEYITNRLYREGGKYVQTDYSSFEALFNAQLQDNCEFQFYRHMLTEIHNEQNMPPLMAEVLMGINRIDNKYFSCMLNACRMSGEMNTSLGNGFSNLMLMNYICDQLGLLCIGVVEGDDGLFVFIDESPTAQQFKDIGCIIKLEVFNELSKASFCGLLFDPEGKQIVTNPYEILAQFGWTTKEYARANSKKLMMLLRSKSLSYMYQYPGCPIVTELANYGLRVSRSFDIRKHAKSGKMSMWEREQLLEALDNKHLCVKQEIKLSTRLLFEELYGISYNEQLLIENALAKLTKLQPLNFKSLIDAVPNSWVHYYEEYAVSLKKNEKVTEVEFTPNTIAGLDSLDILDPVRYASSLISAPS